MPGLTRKPRRNEIITFGHAPQRWRVSHCDGNICWCNPVDNANILKPTCFIWYFPRDRALNNQATIQEAYEHA